MVEMLDKRPQDPIVEMYISNMKGKGINESYIKPKTYLKENNDMLHHLILYMY